MLLISSKHTRTLRAIFDKPTRADISWRDAETLLEALGAKLKEGRGSRVRVNLNGEPAIFHRPHPRKEMDKGAVDDLREFLTKAGVSPMKAYKGYRALVKFDDEAMIFHGRISNISHVVNFQARSPEDLVQAFHDSVDDYLDWCAEDLIEPQKPFSGALSLRATPELHRRMIDVAAAQGKSLNQWMVEALSKQADADSDGPTAVG